MAQTVLITLTTAGADTGPFSLYSNLDGYTVAFESGISRGDLLAGYTSTVVPDSASHIRVKSQGALCSNYIDLTITGITTTSTTSTTTTAAPTTTTTTTLNETIVNIENNATGGLGITLDSLNISDGKTFTVTSGSFPLAQGESLTGKINGQGTYTLTVGVGVGVPPSSAHKLVVTDSGSTPTCENITAGGAYVFNSQVCTSSTTVFIEASDGVC